MSVEDLELVVSLQPAPSVDIAELFRADGARSAELVEALAPTSRWESFGSKADARKSMGLAE
jgi:hypothetical protein